jgi:hypothetical protein
MRVPAVKPSTVTGIGSSGSASGVEGASGGSGFELIGLNFSDHPGEHPTHHQCLRTGEQISSMCQNDLVFCLSTSFAGFADFRGPARGASI